MRDTETPSRPLPTWVICDEEVPIVSLGKKLKQLRKEKGWSQDELAFNAQIDGRQVSRYENDKVTPSIEVVIKMARAFNVSLDFLLIEDAPRRPLQSPMSRLAQRVVSLEDLSEEDERSLLHLLDAIEAKNKLMAIAAGVG
jgi:transcriptional regulator with XRE-family HTH domain